MKTKFVLLAASVAMATLSNGAIAISGTALKNAQGSGVTPVDLVGGRLGLLIADTGNDGFLAGFFTPGNPGSEIMSLTPALAGLTLNSTFGGDLVLARLTSTVAFGDTTIAGNFNGSVTSYLNVNYAIIWFETLTTAGSETQGSGKYGIARGGDWTFPAADSGTFSFGTGTANLDQVTLGSIATAPAGQAVAFATNGTSLSIVPEPSAALLGAIGVLGLLRRRRN